MKPKFNYKYVFWLLVVLFPVVSIWGPVDNLAFYQITGVILLILVNFVSFAWADSDSRHSNVGLGTGMKSGLASIPLIFVPIYVFKTYGPALASRKLFKFTLQTLVIIALVFVSHNLLFRSEMGTTPKRKAKVVEEISAQVDQGDLDALVQLGIFYHLGYGIKKDDRVAATLWEEAAARGSPSGKNHLGLALSQGRGVPQDHARAFSLYESAAMSGHAEAQWRLGVALVTGQGVTKNLLEGYTWIRCSFETAKNHTGGETAGAGAGVFDQATKVFQALTELHPIDQSSIDTRVATCVNQYSKPYWH